MIRRLSVGECIPLTILEIHISLLHISQAVNLSKFSVQRIEPID